MVSHRKLRGRLSRRKGPRPADDVAAEPARPTSAPPTSAVPNSAAPTSIAQRVTAPTSVGPTPAAPALVQAPAASAAPTLAASPSVAPMSVAPMSGAPMSGAPMSGGSTSAVPTSHQSASVVTAWQGVGEQYALKFLLLAEQLRQVLERLEADEEDPDRLQGLYEVDHAVTRMRRWARDLQVLAGRNDDELAGHVASVRDVIRIAASAIEHYIQVRIASVAEFAVVAYATDDLASLLAALLDNATSYSPSVVTVSAHLLRDGAVLIRVEDDGMGMHPDQLTVLNAALAGPVPEVGEWTGKHTGFPVVHRLARRHGIDVRVMCRQPPGSQAPAGTIAVVTVPAQLLCEIPTPVADEVHRPSAPAGPVGPPPVAALPAAAATALRVPGPADDRAGLYEITVNGLPMRRRGSPTGHETRLAAVHGSPAGRDFAEAGRNFAADLLAFTGGDPSGRPSGGEQPDDHGSEPS